MNRNAFATHAPGASPSGARPANGSGLRLLSTLPAGLLEQLLVLVLAHLLAPLLDDRTHLFSYFASQRSVAGDPPMRKRPGRAQSEMKMSRRSTPVVP